MICLACHQEVGDTGLGTPLPHRLQGSQEFCPGFMREEVRVTASPHTAIKEPGRKVRSDKGTKRHPRTKGGESHAKGTNMPSRSQELSSGPLPEWFPPSTFTRGADDSRQPPLDEYEGKRTPREGYIAAAPDWPPLIRTFEEARDLAARYCAQGKPSYVFYVIPIRKLESSIQETRLGRIRRQKAKP